MSKNNAGKVIDNLTGEIDWDNWERDDIEAPRRTYFDLCEVLHCKLDWIRDRMELDCTDKDNEDAGLSEHIDTIRQVQDLLGLLDEKKIRNAIA